MSAALPEVQRSRCREGLENVRGLEPDWSSFGSYTRSHFGAGITDLFMRPYNEKIWVHPLESMSIDWIAERIVLGAEEVVFNMSRSADNLRARS